jgi:hypothetical protein
LSIRDFRVINGPRALPVNFESLFATSIEGRIVLVGTDEHRQALQLSIDRFVGAATEPALLPLSQITGVASYPDSLIVAGVAEDNQPRALRTTAEGDVMWIEEVPVKGELQHWPCPIPGANPPSMLFVTKTPHRQLHIIEVHEAGFGGSRSFELNDDSDGIDALGSGSDLLLARVHDNSSHLELVRVVPTQISRRIEAAATRPSSPSVARAGDRIVVAWIAQPGEPRWQWFDEELRPFSDSQLLPTPSLPGLVARVQLVGGDDRQCVVLLRYKVPIGDPEDVHLHDGTVVHRKPQFGFPLWLAAYGNDGQRISSFCLVDGDARVYAACWADSGLAVAHRGDRTYLSLLEPITAIG